MCTSVWFPLLTFPASRKWVMCSSCAWFPMLTFPGWTPIQDVSHVQLLCLISIADIPWMNSHPASESCAAPVLGFHCWHSLDELPSSLWVMCSSCAWFPLLTFPAWTPIQACQSCTAPLFDFNCWHFLYEIPSRMCVFVTFHILSSVWFWLLIYCFVHCLVCSDFNLLPFFYSINTLHFIDK